MAADATAARRLVDLKADYAEKSAAADEAERRYRAAEADFWADLEEGDDTTVTKDLGPGYGKVQFQRRETKTGRILDPETAEKALIEAGLGDAVLAPQRTIRKKVLNEHVRSLLKSGKKLPEGVDFVARRYVTITRKGES